MDLMDTMNISVSIVSIPSIESITEFLMRLEGCPNLKNIKVGST